MTKEWQELTPEEKRAERFKKLLEPPKVNFSSPEAEQAYHIRRNRIVDTYQMKEPDRVLVELPVGLMPIRMAGISLRTAMYDYNELKRAYKNFLRDFEMDSFTGPAFVPPVKAFELVDYRLYSWPGHGLPSDAMSFQFVEGEYMKANEYDELLKNPSDFWMRTYLPRIFGGFESFRYLQSFTDIIETPTGYFMPFIRPDVQTTLQALIDVGKELPKWVEVVAECTREAQEAGIPSGIGFGNMARAPFDVLGDTLRGTRGIMSDIYRQPDKLLEAMNVIADLTIDATIAAVNASSDVMVMFPLHKGADSFMSIKQFETFYWPPLKKVIHALYNEGIIANLFAEGSYMTRLETVNEFPRGAVAWILDKTDMATAKKILGDKCILSGNVPSSLLAAGTPQEVKEYCRKLIEVCAPGGGYILGGGAQTDESRPENIRAMMEAAKEYGVYKK